MARLAMDLQPVRRSARNIKKEELHNHSKTRDTVKSETRPIKREALASPPSTPKPKIKRIKSEFSPEHPSNLQAIISPLKDENLSPPSTIKLPPSSSDKAAILQARKLKTFATHSQQSPFPTFAHPTPQECALAHRILTTLHGERRRPEKIIASTTSAGCGASPSVLDALVRTILSQNTSDKNSSRAKRSMDQVYGGSDQWAAIVAGGQPKLQQAIQSGGLSVVKSKVIISILEQAKAKYGKYSLDHLFSASDKDAMREMLSFQGVGPKTAGSVLLFCLQRASFAVDTHVYRITGLLGWRPARASREEAQAHLDAKVPDGDKYGLHVLLITHGKRPWSAYGAA